MAHLLYYVETTQPRLGLDQCRELGIDYAFANDPTASRYDGAGPGGEIGLVLCANSDRIGYYPDRQTWRRVPPAAGSRVRQNAGAKRKKGQAPEPAELPEVWVGFWTDDRPTPAELLVAEPLRGHLVRLRDGNEWQIPVARAAVIDGDQFLGGRRSLPGPLDLDEAGNWVPGKPEEKYAALWQVAEAWWDSLIGQQPDETGTVRFNFSGLADAALTAIAANYRLRPVEVALLGLLDDQGLVAVDVLNALVDLPTFRAWQGKKKRAAAG